MVQLDGTPHIAFLNCEIRVSSPTLKILLILLVTVSKYTYIVRLYITYNIL